jgi:hypothetical protein
MLAPPMTLRRPLSRCLALLSPAAFAAFSSACAATLPAAPPPPVVAPRPPAPPVDVTAVAVPDNLIFYGRLSNLTASQKVALDWVRLPAVDSQTLVEGFIEGVTQSKDNAVLATVIDAGQPMDVAASFEVKLPPKMLGAFSAALKNIDQAKTALAAKYDLIPGDNGVLKLTPHADHSSKTEKSDDDDDDGPAACELAPAAGSAPFRLVCGANAEALAALGPYLTRTTPRQTIPADLHLELRARPIGGVASLGRLQGPKMIGSFLGINAATEPATLDLLTAALGDGFDYVADLDTMAVDVTFDPTRAAVSIRQTFKSATSLIAQVSAAHPDRIDVPPSILWRVPGDADYAAFGPGVDDAILQHPRELTLAALNEQLEKASFAEADRHALTELTKDAFHAPRSVLAHGTVDGTSYWVGESEDAPAHTAKVARELAAIFNRPSLLKWLKAKSKSALQLPTWKVGGPIASLPKGTLHLEVTVFPEAPSAASAKGKASAPKKGAKAVAAVDPKPAASAAQAPTVYHVAIVPDGARSWLGISASEAILKAKLVSIIATTPPADSLGLRAGSRGLDGFKDARMSAGGFFTVRALIELAQHSVGQRDPKKVAGWDGFLRGLPTKGETAMVYTSTAGTPTADEPGGSVELRLTVPADAIRDAFLFGVQAGNR